tara:strand:- start:341 stop:1093 length:753 start_codon:yes stop_codon:yes gene_type:complete
MNNNNDNKDNIDTKENKDTKENNNEKEPIQFWINNPYVLFDSNTFLDIWPVEPMTREEKLNAISRFVIYTTFISVFLFRNVKILFTGIITLVILVITYYLLNNKYKNLFNKTFKEGFSDEEIYNKFKDNYTNPTDKNPIMNVLVPEIQDNPQRLQAAPSYNKVVEQKINESAINLVKKNFDDQTIDEKLFNDLGDKFQFEQSMRQFYATANTRVPNNQKDFAQFCYGNMASCKDGDVQECNKSNYRHTLM